MKTGARRASLLLPCLLLAACSAATKVNDITTAEPGATIHGIPFRLADRYRVRVFQLRPDGTYEPVFTDVRDMPNQQRIFALNFKGDPLSDHEFKVVLNSDNTLKSTHLKTTQHISDAANALATQASAVNTALQQRRTAEATARSTSQTLEEAYIDAKGKAEIAVAQYNAALAKTDATAVEIATAKATMELAMKKANNAAANAGKPLPYPGG